jgi:hypothetical protein
MAKKKQKYSILSPDGFSIEFDKTYNGMEEVRTAFEAWKKRFEKQGYYSSNNGKIPLEELEDNCTLIEL